MPPVPRDLHVDRYLTDLSVAFAQDSGDFVSNKVFPVVSVNKASDQFVIYDRGAMWREGNIQQRPLGGKFDTIDWGFSTGTYACVERGAAHKIDDRQTANADQPLDLRRQAMELLTSAVMIDNERRFMTEYFALSIWTADKVDTTDFTEITGPTVGTPLQDIDEFKEEMKRLTALEPNTLVLGPKVWRAIRNHDRVKDVFKYTRPGIISEDLIAMAFGIDRILIPRGVSNPVVEGATDALEFVIGATDDESALLTYSPGSPGLSTPSAGYTFAYTGLIPGATNAMGGVIQTGRDEFAHSDHLEIRKSDDMQLVAADLGIFLSEWSQL